jgi:membrane protein implicated in regulation of membrane protease activity
LRYSGVTWSLVGSGLTGAEVIPAGSEVEVVGVEPGKFFVARPAERAP